MKASKTYDGTILYERKRGEPSVRLGGSREAADWFNGVFYNLLSEVHREKEYFLMATLDARNQVKHAEVIAIGCLTGSLIHPREVFVSAIKRSAAAIILSHNHPSGDPTPSPEDVQLNERLAEAGRILGIKCLDHVICAEGGYVSLFERHGSSS
jgi:DNA repair protein RadC